MPKNIVLNGVEYAPVKPKVDKPTRKTEKSAKSPAKKPTKTPPKKGGKK